MKYKYKVVDKDNNEIPQHAEGRLRTLEEANELVNSLNKTSGWLNYSVVKDEEPTKSYKYAITDFSNDNVIIFHSKMSIKELREVIEKEEDYEIN